MTMSYLSSLQGVEEMSGMCPDLLDAKLEPHSDSELDEWLQFFDSHQNEVNDLLLKWDKQETAGQVLQNIDNLENFDDEYWVKESPLFEEIQSLVPFYNVDTESCVTTVCPQSESVKTEKAYNGEMCEGVNVENSPNTNLDTDLTEITSVLLSNETSELAVVDEILKNTVIGINNWESDTSRSEISSDSGSNSEVALSPVQEDSSDDAEWKPGPMKRTRSDRKNYYKKSKTYWRGGSQEDKRLRKKEQNKNAATRYRQKKKAEISEILKEERELMEKKSKLEEKVFDIQNEIRYLKGLMRDLFKAKGLIN